MYIPLIFIKICVIYKSKENVEYIKKEKTIMKAKLCAAAALTLAVVMGTSSAAFAGNSKYFRDVNDGGYGWASEAVDYLVQKGIVAGVGDNLYAPELQIERGDFVLLLNNTFDLGQHSTYVYGFTDVHEDDYYYTAVINAKGAGAITDDYAFYPQQPITRGYAMQMLYKALDLNGYITDATTDLSMYSDADVIRDVKAQMAIASLTKMGIISGNDGRINYNDAMSRAEMAMVFYKAVNYMDEHPVEKKSSSAVTQKPDTGKKTQEEPAEEEENASTVLSGVTKKAGVVIDGTALTGIENSTVSVADPSEKAVEIINNAAAEISDSTVKSNASNAVSVYARGRSSAEITNSELYNLGSGSAALRGEDGSKIEMTGGSIQTKSPKSNAVKTAGSVTLDSVGITVSDGSAVFAEDAGKAVINGGDIVASNVSEGLFKTAAGKNDDENDKAEITVKGTNITGDRKTTLFYIDKNDLKARLENCDIEKVKYLIDSRATSNNKNNTVEITLINQTLEADVISEENARIIINLKDGSYLKASINELNRAEYVEVNVEEGSKLELTSNSYIHVLKFNDAIDINENGYLIYYDTDLAANDWLYDGDYQLANGGMLTPQ